MATSNNRILGLIKKTFKFFAFTILGLFIIANLFILLTGRTYLYKGMMSTYLVGKTSPTIYDLDVFPYRTVKKGIALNDIHKSVRYNKAALPKGFETYIKNTKTRAFLVYKNGELVFEKYWGHHTKSTVSNSFSAAKTVVALLIGCAIEDGKITSMDEPVGNYLPEFKEGDKAKITIRHLLDMASGLDWTESGKDPLSNNAESYYGTDLYGLVTRQKVIREPGVDFIYQSGNSQLLGFIVQKATGKSVSDYCSEKIWSKIGMESDAYWSLDKENGDEKAFCCLYATGRDFARIATLIMHNGKWGETQVLPAWYMTEMFKVNHSMGTEEGVPNHQYNMHLWLYEGYKNPIQYCRGIKGQYLISIPAEDVVIVRLGEQKSDNFEVPTKKSDYKKGIPLVGHPKDLPAFISFGEKILSNSKL